MLWGGWYADKLRNKGIANGRIRVGLIAAAEATLCSFFIPFISTPQIALALFFVPAFFLASHMRKNFLVKTY
jgi:hypothetical protein